MSLLIIPPTYRGLLPLGLIIISSIYHLVQLPFSLIVIGLIYDKSNAHFVLYLYGLIIVDDYRYLLINDY